MPGRVRARMPVQQHHRRSLTAVTDTENHLADIHRIKREAVKHRLTATHKDRVTPHLDGRRLVVCA